MSPSIFQFLSIRFKILLIFLHSPFYHNSWTFVYFRNSSAINALRFLTRVHVRKEFEMRSCWVTEIKSSFANVNWWIVWTMQLMRKIKMNKFILSIHILICSLSPVFSNLTFKITHHISLRLRFRPDHPVHVGWSSVSGEHWVLTGVFGIYTSSITWTHVSGRNTWCTWRPIWIMMCQSFCLSIITDNSSCRIGSSPVEISCSHSSCHFGVFYQHRWGSC